MKDARKTKEQLIKELGQLRRRIAKLERLQAKEERAGKGPRRASRESALQQSEAAALLEASRAVLTYREFQRSARAIFDSCKDLLEARSGYVALLSEDGAENEVLFLESGGLPCTVDPDLPMPIRGLRAEAYRTGKAVYDNNFPDSEWMRFMPEGHARLENVLFAPLVVEGKTVGLLGLANKEGDFTEDDARMAQAFGDIGSIALVNSRTLELLGESEERFRSVVETATDAIITTDSSGIIVSWNRGAETIFGYSADEVVGESHTVLVPERLRDVDQAGLKRLLSSGKSPTAVAPMTIMRLRKDGSEVPIELSVSSARIGGRTFITAIMRDITGRKRAEENLREARDYLSNVLESSVDAIVTTDSRGRIVKPNRSFLVLLGFEEGEVVGKHMSRLSPWAEGTYESTTGDTVEIGSEFVDRSWKMMARLGEEEKRVSDWGSYLLRKDGKVVPVEQSIVSLRDEAGEVIGAVGVLRDVTEKGKAEKDLRETKEFLERVIESSGDGILITDDKGVIISVNSAMERMYGENKGGFVGKHAATLVIEDAATRQCIREQTLELFDKGFTFFETRHKAKDGAIIDVEVNTSMVKDERGNYVAAVSIIRDISERKKMERHLVQSEKLRSLGEMAAGVAHDFNNLLSVILGRAQLLRMNLEKYAGRERRRSAVELKRSLGAIERAAFDGAETVRRVQEFSRPTADERGFTQVNLNGVVEGALDLTRVRWKNEAELRGVKVEIEKELSSLPLIVGNPSELREVTVNLLQNAIDAMPQGGAIKIRTFVEDDRACLTVEDAGTGMSREVMERVFDPFFTTKGPQSTGLGMSVSYGIITRHQGTILAESVEGRGSTFTVALPVRRLPEAADLTAEELKAAGKGARVLVVEDEEDVRTLLSDILSLDGHEVTVAADGKEGMGLFRRGGFDFVFTDLGMPDLSGWEVARAVRGIDPDVPVAMITGWGIQPNKEELEESGVDLIANKPFKVDQILELVRGALRVKRGVTGYC
jgi:PAS domain S-box-containing protein